VAADVRGIINKNPLVSLLLIVTGPPGAGKSAVASLLIQRFDRSVLVEGDSFFRFIQRGAIVPWLKEADPQNEIVTQAAAAAAGRYAAGGFTTIFDGMVGPWFLPTFLQETGLAGVEYAVLLPSVELCVERVRLRQDHGFSDEAATRQMHQAFVDARIERRHVLDPPDDAAAVADLVIGSLDEGSLYYGAAV
jgi:predicted ABC-type ATPase